MTDSTTIPRKLDGADVLFVAKRDGRSFVQCGEDRLAIVALAIACYPGTSDHYLFSLGDSYEVIGDSDCHSVAEAMELAETSHRIKRDDWKQAV
jgi:hypothetical protein